MLIAASSCVCILALSGCNLYEKEDAKLANPVITSKGTYDGCEVKFVDRGYQTESFYLARCVEGDTSTTTQHYEYRSGKANLQRSSVTILNELKYSGLSKLTKEEQKALGLN